MRYLFFFFFYLQSLAAFPQEAKTFRITSPHTSFPDTGRTNGHRYANVLYPAEGHYDDSSVLIVVPPHFRKSKKTDLIFWFHGWRNHIDSVVDYFGIVKQFIASNRNAILVIPESAKNSPDSYGGKLEQKQTFALLVQDVFNRLIKEKLVSRKTKPGNITLAGHSGAFRVMAFILQNGGMEVDQVLLYDGLYSQVDKYTAWIQADSAHRFIHIYTNKGGGTDLVSTDMMKLLHEKNIPFVNPEEKEITGELLRKNRVIFIHSLKEHNDVINRPDDNFRLLIETGPLSLPQTGR